MTEPLIEVRNMTKHFPITRGILIQKQIGAVQAVDDVSFDIFKGETLGIVGRDGLRQEHDGAPGHAPARAHLGHDLARGRGHHHARRRPRSRACAARCRWSSRTPTAR